MQHQVDQTDQSPENDRKPLFWLFGSFKNAFLWHLNDPSWPGNVAECWKAFSTITICNIESIQQTKLKKMTKNLFFGSLDHSKCILVIFEWLSWPDNIALCCKTFSTITICNIKSIQQTWLQKNAKNLFFGSLDHSKMQFCDFWMIQHKWYHGQIVSTI